jgi:hypothetical protein
MCLNHAGESNWYDLNESTVPEELCNRLCHKLDIWRIWRYWGQRRWLLRCLISSNHGVYLLQDRVLGASWYRPLRGWWMDTCRKANGAKRCKPRLQEIMDCQISLQLTWPTDQPLFCATRAETKVQFLPSARSTNCITIRIYILSKHQ